MSRNTAEKHPEFTNANILQFVRSHEDPAVTAKEVAGEFGVTSEAANYRLKKLREEGKVTEKWVGASAKVWYIVG